jgi:hypothetical protein
VGGSILGSFPSFAPMWVTQVTSLSHLIPSHLIVIWVTQAEYQEGGKSVLAKKCP